MADRHLTQEYVRSLFHYDPETGVLTWKERPREHFSNSHTWAAMNTRCAGKKVGSRLSKTSSYLSFCLKGKGFLVHRVIWVWVHGENPEEIDHINGDKADNRLVNLRNVSRGINMMNKAQSKKNTSGVTGVVWHKAARKWTAQIRIDGKNHYLGVFNTVSEASEARMEASQKFGFHANHGRS